MDYIDWVFSLDKCIHLPVLLKLSSDIANYNQEIKQHTSPLRLAKRCMDLMTASPSKLLSKRISAASTIMLPSHSTHAFLLRKFHKFTIQICYTISRWINMWVVASFIKNTIYSWCGVGWRGGGGGLGWGRGRWGGCVQGVVGSGWQGVVCYY